MRKSFDVVIIISVYVIHSNGFCKHRKPKVSWWFNNECILLWYWSSAISIVQGGLFHPRISIANYIDMLAIIVSNLQRSCRLREQKALRCFSQYCHNWSWSNIIPVHIANISEMVKATARRKCRKKTCSFMIYPHFWQYIHSVARHGYFSKS